jgi:hypothetical protein
MEEAQKKDCQTAIEQAQSACIIESTSIPAVRTALSSLAGFNNIDDQELALSLNAMRGRLQEILAILEDLARQKDRESHVDREILIKVPVLEKDERGPLSQVFPKPKRNSYISFSGQKLPNRKPNNPRNLYYYKISNGYPSPQNSSQEPLTKGQQGDSATIRILSLLIFPLGTMAASQINPQGSPASRTLKSRTEKPSGVWTQSQAYCSEFLLPYQLRKNKGQLKNLSPPNRNCDSQRHTYAAKVKRIGPRRSGGNVGLRTNKIQGRSGNPIHSSA